MKAIYLILTAVYFFINGLVTAIGISEYDDKEGYTLNRLFKMVLFVFFGTLYIIWWVILDIIPIKKMEMKLKKYKEVEVESNKIKT